MVLDEITYMINYNYLDEKSILKVLSNRPKDQHVVLTGRAASEGIIEASDTVSEVKDIKHAFRANIRGSKRNRSLNINYFRVNIGLLGIGYPTVTILIPFI